MFPDLKYCFYEDFKNLSFDEIKNKKFDFIIIPPWEKNKLKGKNFIDLFINSVSFQEMDKEIILDRKVDSNNPNLYQIITKRVQSEDKSFYKEIKEIPRINPSKFKWNFQNILKLIARYTLNIFMFFFPKKILYKIFKIYF